MTQAVADQLFLSYMGRAADTQWRNSTSALTTSMGDQPTKALKDAFYTLAVSEGVYATADSPSNLVNKFFLNTFGFAARTDEQTFWGNLVANGTYSAGEMVWQMFSSYANNTSVLPTTYVVPMQSKLVALAAYSDSLAANPTQNAAYSQLNTTASASGRSFLAAVTNQATAATAVTSAPASVAAFTVASSGSAFTLTTGVDNTTATNITGLIDQNTAANTTWNLSDSVSSTAGTFNLSVITAGAALAGFNTSGVTTLKIKAIDNVNTATASSFDVGSMTGLKAVSMANASVIGATADTFTINSAASGTTVALDTNGSTQNVTVNFASAATSGAADTATVSVTGRSGTFLLGTGFETLALTGGTAGRVAAANSETTASIKTVTVGGVDLRVDAALDSTVTSIDASNATGTVNLNVAPGTTFSGKGGKGAADVLAVSVLSSTHTVTGFETVVATAAATYDLTGTDAVNLGVGVGAGAVTFSNAAATQNNIVVGGLQQRTTGVAATGNLTTGGALTYTLKTATGTADTLNIAANNGGTASTGTMTIGGAVTTTAVETVNLAMTDWKAVAIGGNVAFATTATANGKFVATGSSNLSLGANAITFANGLASGTDTVDLTGLTGTFTGALTMGAGNLTFAGGSGVTTLTTSAPVTSKTQDITTGAAADVITITSMATTAGTTKVNTGAGDDRITLDAAVTQTTTDQLISIDGGAGTDLLATVGTANAKTINATISNIETIQLEAGGATTTLNFTVASGYADTVRIIDASGQIQTIAFNTSAGGTVNLSKVSTVGWTSGTDFLAVNSNTGNESFTFGATTSAAGAIIETYNIQAVATNGIDTITGFTVASDVINVTAAAAYLNTTTEAVLSVTATNTAGAANDNILLLGQGFFANAAAVVAAGGTWGSGITNATSHVLIAYQTAAGSAIRIADAILADAGGATSATDLVVLTGVTTLTDLVAANFIMD